MKLLSFFALFIKKHHWVICERGTDARDNGWHFYQYMKKSHPEIKIYYVIDTKSADYEKVKVDAIQYGSIKNYWIVVTAKRIVSSHIATCVPHLYGRPWKYSRLGKKFYFLQHGVIKDDLIGLHKETAQMKLFICGAKPEYEYIKDTYGHGEDVVQYTGLARYDNLHDIKTKKQILIMPTWRKFIYTKEDFLTSKYFQEWNGLLKNKKLIEILQKGGYELIFYPHYEVQKYLNYFNNEGNDYIKIASFKDYDVQTLLKESTLLITDFSSVFFDFGYMKKPIIYFQFDADLFFDKHYKKGYFDYKEHGFGNVCLVVEEVVEEIEKYLLNDCAMEDIYLERLKGFFPLHDTNNCQRIYEKIIEK